MDIERTKSMEENFANMLDEYMTPIYMYDEADEDEISWEEFWDMCACEEMCAEIEFAEACTKHQQCKAKHSRRRKNNLNPRKRGKPQKGSWSHASRAWNHFDREKHLKPMHHNDMMEQIHEYEEEKEPIQEVYEDNQPIIEKLPYPLNQEMLLKRLAKFVDAILATQREYALLNMLREAIRATGIIWNRGSVFYGCGYLGLDFFREEIIQMAMNAMGFELTFVKRWEDSCMLYQFNE